VPESHATEKKLNGTIPQSTKTGNCGDGFGKIFVKTKVNTPIITIGLSNDQRTPNDIFR
jgi:hypothetical protein